MLATAVAVHIATRAPQIFLKMLVVACIAPAAEPSAAAFARWRHEFPDRVMNQRRNLAPPLIWINEGRFGIKPNVLPVSRLLPVCASGRSQWR